MRYIRLFENFGDYDPYELMILPPNKKGEMLMGELKKYNPNLDLVRDLITLGANLNWQGEYGYAALHWCAMNYRLEITKMLIDAGADLNVQDENGMTALHLCAAYNRIEVAKMLIDAGADLNVQDWRLSYTPLHECARKSYPEIAKMLIDAGADKTIQDDDGKLPYEIAKTQELKKLLKP